MEGLQGLALAVHSGKSTKDEDEEQIPRGRSPSQRTSGISLLLAVASQGHCTCGQGLRIPLNLVNNSFPVKDPVETDTVS